jgi:hypothetical protein
VRVEGVAVPRHDVAGRVLVAQLVGYDPLDVAVAGRLPELPEVVLDPPRREVAAAAALDNLKLPEVVGSIAGDDTIMAAVRTADETVLLMEKIRRMLEEE